MALTDHRTARDTWQAVRRRNLAAQAVFSDDPDLPPYGPAVEVALEHLSAAADVDSLTAALEEAAWVRVPEDEVLERLERSDAPHR